MNGIQEIMALGGAIGSSGAVVFIVIRGFVQGWTTHQRETTRRQVTSAKRDESLIPEIQADFARQREELWAEIQRLRKDLDKLSDKLDDSLSRERNCEARVAALQAQLDSIKRDVKSMRKLTPLHAL